MSKREPSALLDDIRTSISKIERYTAGLDAGSFLVDEKTIRRSCTQLTPDSEMKTVIVLMGADPKPGDDIAFPQAERAVMISDANYTDTVTAYLEVQ